MFISAQVKYIVLSLLCVIAIFNITRTTSDIISKSKRLEELRSDVSTLETEKAALEQELAFKQTDEFVEQEARNKLNLVKPGEEVYIIPTDPDAVSSNFDVLAATDENIAVESNVQQWINLFF